MKDVFMLLGFSFGLVTGALMYKYSASAKQTIDESEKKIMKEAQKLGQKAEKGMEKLSQKAEEGLQTVEKKIKKGAKQVQKKLKTN